jgi:hypothetical protein
MGYIKHYETAWQTVTLLVIYWYITKQYISSLFHFLVGKDLGNIELGGYGSGPLSVFLSFGGMGIWTQGFTFADTLPFEPHLQSILSIILEMVSQELFAQAGLTP